MTVSFGDYYTLERWDRISWYWKGLLHREDGPAVEYFDGRQEWWLNGEFQEKNYVP